MILVEDNFYKKIPSWLKIVAKQGIIIQGNVYATMNTKEAIQEKRKFFSKFCSASEQNTSMNIYFHNVENITDDMLEQNYVGEILTIQNFPSKQDLEKEEEKIKVVKHFYSDDAEKRDGLWNSNELVFDSDSDNENIKTVGKDIEKLKKEQNPTASTPLDIPLNNKPTGFHLTRGTQISIGVGVILLISSIYYYRNKHTKTVKPTY